MVHVKTPNAAVPREKVRHFALTPRSLSARRVTQLFTVGFLGTALLGCSCSDDEGKKSKAVVAPASAPPPDASKKKTGAQPLTLGHRYPVGPALVLVPGKGAGAIRFGATVETIERHMESPCDSKTNERCLYVRQAIEFFLKDGVLSRIKAHRRDRQVPHPPPKGDQYFGSLRGIVQPKIMMGLHRHIVVEEFGAPQKEEAVTTPGSDGLVDKHFYDGIIFEYDKIENGNVVLAGIELYPSETAKNPAMKTITPSVPGPPQAGGTPPPPAPQKSGAAPQPGTTPRQERAF
jgi:hypothetical protein